MRGAPPGATLRLIRSTAGPGQGPCPPPLNGGCAGLLSPDLLLTTTAAANGTLLIERTVPAAVSPGTTIGFQVLAQVGTGPAQGTPPVPVRIGP